MQLSVYNFKKDQSSEEKSSRAILCPLKYGKAVALVVNDKKMPKKKRIGDPVLFITPLYNLIRGVGTRTFVFSLQGYGCEIINIDTARVKDLWRTGLSMRTSKVLLLELKSVLNINTENNHV